MLGVVANNDPEDNDDADTSEVQYNNESRRSMAGDTKAAHIDQGIFTEKITKEQLDELYYELQEYPIMVESLKKALEINNLSDMPKAKYNANIQNIRKQKMSLMNSPRKEW